MKTMNIRRLLLGFGACALLSGAASAQGYYDDDIYFDADKAKKEAKKSQAENASSTVYYSGSERNVDEYNRRGDYTPVAESTTDLGDNLEYTRRIERFHNPDIVIKSNDSDLLYYYDYANDELADVNGYTSPTTINIYVDNPDPWDLYWSPYYYSSAWSWAWRHSYYNPWWTYNFTWGYGPSLSWSWNWGPSWSWNWHWGPSWSWNWGWNHGCGWYPPHHHHHGPSWIDKPNHRPHWAGSGASGTPGRPASVGDNRGRRPSGTYPGVSNDGGRRPSGAVVNGSTSGRRPSGGTISAENVGRPSGNSNGLYNPSNASRPGNTGTVSGRGGTRRANTSVTNTSSGRSSGSGTRGSYNSSSSSSSRNKSSGTRSGSYNSGSSSSRSSMSTGRSSSGGSRSSGSMGRSGGGSSRGGGGRSSGGRR